MNLVWNVVTTGTMAGPLRYDQIDHIPAHLLDKLPRKISKSFYSALLKLQFCKILPLYFTPTLALGPKEKRSAHFQNLPLMYARSLLKIVALFEI